MSTSTIPQKDEQVEEVAALTVVEQTDLTVEREPDLVLKEAKRAAVALTDVISKKKKPVIMNGEQYLEFEDWQTVGRFYGVTAKVESTNPVEMSGVAGFEASAVALHTATGRVISRAESMCMQDERNWQSKPLFQLRSMAQTRACAKALRNVLAWVVVLAGYRPTPAEEMTHGNGQQREASKPRGNGGGRKASKKQVNMLWAKAAARAEETGIIREEIMKAVLEALSLAHSHDIPAASVDEAVQLIADYEPSFPPNESGAKDVPEAGGGDAPF